MLDVPSPSLAAAPTPVHAAWDRSALDVPWRAVERRRARGPLFDRMLDELNLEVIVMTASARLVYANRAAQRAMARGEPFAHLGSQVDAGSARDNAALLRATRGRRVLLPLGQGAGARLVALVPLSSGEPGARAATPGAWTLSQANDEPQVMSIAGRSKIGGPLDLQLFAHEHALTSAESHVLDALCQGRAPRDIAVDRETRLSTVRTQIASIKAKTGACSIRDLVNRVAMLPPLVPLFA